MKGLCESWVSRHHSVRGVKEAGLWQGPDGWVLVGSTGQADALVETRARWRGRRKDGLWTRTRKWRLTNCSSSTSSMSFMVPDLLVSPCTVTETNVMSKSHSVTQRLTCLYRCGVSHSQQSVCFQRPSQLQ